MRQYLIKRLLQVIPVLFGVSLVVFLMLHLSGDPAKVILGSTGVMITKEDVQRLHAELGLDRPIPVQYASWLWRLLQGDFGRSFFLRRDIFPILLERLLPTVVLIGSALAVSVVIGIPAGVSAAARRGSVWDRAIDISVTTGIAIPVFFLGIVLILVFGLYLGWLPVSGLRSAGAGPLRPLDLLSHLILPAVSLGAAPASVIARVTRSSLLEVLGQDFIRTARAKGLPHSAVVWRHAFRNTLIAVITVVGLQAGFLLGGSVLVEVVFAWPGVGRLVVEGVFQRDFPLVQATVLFLSVAYVFINLAADLLYAVADPRIRYD